MWIGGTNPIRGKSNERPIGMEENHPRRRAPPSHDDIGYAAVDFQHGRVAPGRFNLRFESLECSAMGALCPCAAALYFGAYRFDLTVV